MSNFFTTETICLDIFSDNYSYTEIGDLEYIQAYGSMKKFMTPEQFLKCRNKEGVMIGVAYYYWDFHKSLQMAWGDFQKLEGVPFEQPENLVFHTFWMLFGGSGALFLRSWAPSGAILGTQGVAFLTIGHQ